MTKITLVVCTGLLCFLAACNNEAKDASGTVNSLTQKNLDASHIVNKAFETGDISMIDSAVASDFVGHSEHGDMGRDSLKAVITSMHKGNSDMKMEVTKEVADNDYVFTQMHFSGTSDGSMGMPKGPYDMHQVQVVRFKDGKAMEHWGYTENSDVMKMMGQMAPADSSKKK